MKRRTNRLLALVAAPILLGALVALAPPAVAQQGGGGLRPPLPQRAETNPPRWLHFGVVLILGAATVAVAVMPSKRSHQD